MPSLLIYGTFIPLIEQLSSFMGNTYRKAYGSLPVMQRLALKRVTSCSRKKNHLSKQNRGQNSGRDMLLFFFVIQPAVAVAFEVGIGNLAPEFLTHTDVLICFLQAARTVAILLLQSFADHIHDFLVFVKDNSHNAPRSLLFSPVCGGIRQPLVEHPHRFRISSTLFPITSHYPY